jgi:hypothetical protein
MGTNEITIEKTRSTDVRIGFLKRIFSIGNRITARGRRRGRFEAFAPVRRPPAKSAIAPSPQFWQRSDLKP